MYVWAAFEANSPPTRQDLVTLIPNSSLESGVILGFEHVDQDIISNFTNNLFGCQKVS
jgi:hypothetical protein